MREPYRVEAEQLYPQPEINGIPLAFLPVSARLNPSALALLGRTRHPTDGSKRTWITWDGNNLLWLPPEYRPGEFAVKGNYVGIGCGSGVVYILNFRADVL
jgi:hypothetical protein